MQTLCYMNSVLLLLLYFNAVIYKLGVRNSSKHRYNNLQNFPFSRAVEVSL